MSAEEVAEWQAFFVVEPFGPLRDNFHSAQIAHILANSNRRPNSPEIPFRNFFYTDAETKRRLNERRMVSMFQVEAEKED